MIVLILATATLAACEPSPEQKEYERLRLMLFQSKVESEIQARETCRLSGGMPLFSSWDGMMMECVVPPVGARK